MIYCKSCNSKIGVQYKHLGLDIKCPKCSSIQKIGIENFNRVKNTGYEITFRDFLRLIKDKKNNKEINTLIEKRLKYSVTELDDMKTAFINKENELIPYEFLHLSIQNDKKTQKTLYQIAMSIWR